ncbi:MAG: hypothetical protein QHH07_08075 [Sedimentisphaerales bacterium]|nr:hypothetical protein [Sedimentisphaerales bacterium]
MNLVFLACIAWLLYLGHAYGNPFQINTYTSMDQKDPAAASGLDRCIVVWNSYRQDGESGGIFGQLVDVNGPIGPEFQINAISAGNQAEPTVAIDQLGRIMVAWRGPWEGLDDSEIVARILDPNGQALTGQIHVNTFNQQAQAFPKVAAGLGERFFVVWQSDQGPASSKFTILGQLVGATGQLLGTELEVSDTPAYATRFPDVAAGPDGSFAVCWLEDRTTDAVRVRLFDPNGQPRGASVKVNTIGLSSLSRPSLGFLSDGRMIVVWDGDPNRASEDDIRARILDMDGRPIGDEFVVNSTTTGAQQYPRLACAEDGNILVVWEGPAGDANSGIKIFGRIVGPTVGMVGPEMLISNLEGSQRSPVVSLLDGSMLVVWEDQQQDGSGSGIFGTILAIGMP